MLENASSVTALLSVKVQEVTRPEDHLQKGLFKLKITLFITTTVENLKSCTFKLFKISDEYNKEI
jgi:hypothetical protein